MAANKTTFKPGEGGRPKGSANKTTIEIKEFLTNFISDNLNTFQSDFDQLGSKDRLNFMERLLKIIIPRPQDIKQNEPLREICLPEWLNDEWIDEVDEITN